MKWYLTLLFTFSSHALANSLYYCEEWKSLSFTLEKDKPFLFFGDEKIILKGEVGEGSKSPVSLKLSIEQMNDTLEGNAATVELVRVGPHHFLEQTGSGNVHLWAFFRSNGEKPAILFQQKSYELVDPAAYTIAYKCK